MKIDTINLTPCQTIWVNLLLRIWTYPFSTSSAYAFPKLLVWNKINQLIKKNFDHCNVLLLTEWMRIFSSWSLTYIITKIRKGEKTMIPKNRQRWWLIDKCGEGKQNSNGKVKPSVLPHPELYYSIMRHMPSYTYHRYNPAFNPQIANNACQKVTLMSLAIIVHPLYTKQSPDSCLSISFKGKTLTMGD